MRPYSISSAQFGINRLRNKAGAKPDSFYDLLNCYVTSERTVVPRPGTVRDVELPGTTKGLMTFEGKLWTFSGEPETSPDPSKYVIATLQHPDPASTANLRAIHFAKPFLGFPYVVAEFDDDPTRFYHYWLQGTGSWQANTVYIEGEVVQPTAPNGYTYAAGRLGPANPTWTAGRTLQVGDIVEPTTPNGYQYRVIDVAGTNPVTGATEPTWIATEGAIVYDDADSTPAPAPSPAPPTVPPSVGDRYGNQGGSGGRLTRETRSEQ